MKMPRDVADIDRLIEDGLTRYGQGDLDGALRTWEQVLAVDPENAQANSYVDYVRMNYEILTADTSSEDRAPFGISEDEPDYQIEIMPGEVQPADAAPLYMDPMDEGWFLDNSDSYAFDPDAGDESSATTLELEADEPPEREDRRGLGDISDVSFEDATREYPYGAGRPNTDLLRHDTQSVAEFSPEATPAFGGPEDLQTPTGFNTQVTEHKKRDLGFVRPTREKLEQPKEAETVIDRPRRASAAPELKMTLRTPPSETAPPPARAPSRAETQAGGPDPRPPGAIEAAIEAIELEAEPPPAPGTFELSYAGPDDAPDDLIASLPSPRPAPSFSTTRDLPPPVITPAAAPVLPPEPAPKPEPAQASDADLDDDAPEISLGETQDIPVLSTAPTRELGTMPSIALAASPTQDFSERPTQQVPSRVQLDPLISAPTRELGLRPGRTVTEDEPTIAALRSPRADTMTMPTGSTRADLVLPFDPIDARSAEILEQIDQGAPAQEPKDERTRRRITTLLDRAGEWSRTNELDRAVTAVDLALSEDPNSALAQKLIHRNRDTIQNVFQLFLGDLERQPILARPLHELGSAPISPRAAFLLSRIDGQLSLDEILDVSGMPRLEAYRYLCQLLLRGILR